MSQVEVSPWESSLGQLGATHTMEWRTQAYQLRRARPPTSGFAVPQRSDVWSLGWQVATVLPDRRLPTLWAT